MVNRCVRVGVCLGTSWVVGREVLRGVYAVGAPLDWTVSPVDTEDLPRVAAWTPDVLIVNDLSWDDIRGHLRDDQVVVGVEVELPPGRARSATARLDNRAIGSAAAGHLVACGLHTLAGFGYAGHTWWDDRFEGFRAVAGAAGCAVDRCEVVPTSRPRTGAVPCRAFDQIQPWLRSLPRPAGVFAGCDAWGRTVVEEATAAGLRVPEDVAVIAADNDDLFCALTRPELTSVIIPWNALGMVAARLAHDLLQGRAPVAPPPLEPPGVAVRRSSEVLAVRDPDVAAALGVIRAHRGKRCGVRDVLRQVPAGRHRLERGFRRELGRTMTEEIRRIHVDEAKRLLATTDLLLADVAARSGFANANKMGIAFRKETAQSPSEYRARFRVTAAP